MLLKFNGLPDETHPQIIAFGVDHLSISAIINDVNNGTKLFLDNSMMIRVSESFETVSEMIENANDDSEFQEFRESMLEKWNGLETLVRSMKHEIDAEFEELSDTITQTIRDIECL